MSQVQKIKQSCQDAAAQPQAPEGDGNRRGVNVQQAAAAAQAALARVDALLQQFGPIIEAATPPQFAAYEAFALSLIHQANGLVNPPAPSVAPAS